MAPRARARPRHDHTTTTTTTTSTTTATTGARPARLLGVGISGGIIPCPTALVVLLAAISLHRVGYGLVLIVAFSLGLAATMSGIGLLAVAAQGVFGRVDLDGGVVRLLPGGERARRARPRHSR